MLSIPELRGRWRAFVLLHHTATSPSTKVCHRSRWTACCRFWVGYVSEGGPRAFPPAQCSLPLSHTGAFEALDSFLHHFIAKGTFQPLLKHVNLLLIPTGERRWLGWKNDHKKVSLNSELCLGHGNECFELLGEH